MWVLAVVARPYQWWRIAPVAASALGYVAIFRTTLAREKFMLTLSNVKLNGRVGAGSAWWPLLIEASWWIQGRVLQEPRLLWRAAD